MIPKLFDAFLFSEPMETEVLLAKLHSESAVVDSWVAVENGWTTKGDRKSVYLRSILDSDERFSEFRSRLHVVSVDTRYSDAFKRAPREVIERQIRRRLGKQSSYHESQYREKPFFFAEYAQRDEAIPILLEISNGVGKVIVSDVDEILDTSTEERRIALDQALASGARVIHLPRKRFIYDFDNLLLGRFRHVPMIDIQHLRSGALRMGPARSSREGMIMSHCDMVYEYSYCYGADGIRRKLRSFAHTTELDAVDVALQCNHSIVPRGTLPRDDAWCMKVSLDEAKHPAYVAANFDRLRTNAVNQDYVLARQAQYPTLFGS